ncbi:MAG: hypothetical protein ACPGJS_04835 [Flammeovirgaceae bacterium]
MKKFTYILPILLCWTVSSFAQNVSWGLPSKTQEEQGFEVQWVADGTEFIYKVKSKYDLSIFDTRVIVEKYKFSNLEKLGEETISKKEPRFTNNGIFQKEGLDFLFFAREFKGGELVLSWQDVNIATGAKGTRTEIARIKGKNINNSGRFIVAQSADKEYYAVLQEQMFVKKTNEKVAISLFDKNFKLVKTVSYQYPYLAKRGPIHNLYVSDEGDVYLVKNVKQPKMKPFLSLFYWDQTKNSLTEHSLKLENNLQILQFQGQFQDNSLFIQGVFTTEGSKGIQMKVGYAGSEGATANGILAAKFTKGKKDYLQMNKTDRLYNVNLKAFEIGDEKTFGMFDRLFVEKKNKPGTTNTDFQYDYFYSYSGFYMAMLDNATGKLDWLSTIEDEEPKSKNDGGDLLSYVYHIGEENIVVFYNDTRKGYRYPVKEVYDMKGARVSKADIFKPGLGGTGGTYFNLSMDTFFPLRDNIYLIKAKSAVESKLGKMQLN